MLSDEHGNGSVLQEEFQPRGRLIGVERDVGSAGLEDPQHADDQLGRAFQAQPHACLGADSQTPQMMRQLVGPLVQRGRSAAAVRRPPRRLPASGRPAARTARARRPGTGTRRPCRSTARAGAGVRARSSGAVRRAAGRHLRRSLRAASRSGRPSARSSRPRTGRCCRRRRPEGRRAAARDRSPGRTAPAGRSGLDVRPRGHRVSGPVRGRLLTWKSTWTSGLRLRCRSGSSSSTSFSKGRS